MDAALDLGEAGRAEHHRAETRRIILILAVCGFASTFAMRSVDPIVGVIAHDLDSDPHAVALLSTAFALPYAFVQPVLGPIGDALGKVRIMKICLAVLTVALVAATFMSRLDALFVLRVVSGGAAGGVIPLALATIGDRVEMGERQVAISRFLLFSISGQLLGGSFSGVLSAWIGWRGVFGLSAAMALGATLAIVVGLRGTGRSEGRFSLSVAVERYTRILSIGRARWLFAFVFTEGIFVFGIQPYIAPMLDSRGAGGAPQAGFILAAFAAGGILYTLCVRGLLRALGMTRMLVVAGAINLAAYLVLALDLAWPIEAAAMLAIGLGFYMLHNSFQTQVTEVVRDARASAVSLHAFFYFVGQALGPVLFGFGLATAGDRAAKIACGIGLLGLGFVAAKVLATSGPAPQPRPR